MPSTKNIEYSLALRSLREQQGMSAVELSKRAALPDYTVSRLENGRLNLDFATAAALMRTLGVSLDYFEATASTLPPAIIAHEQHLQHARQAVNALNQKARYLRRGFQKS